MNNIILIGMPSSGKSTLGKILARRLGYAFLDADDVIKEQNGCELQDIIDRDGLEVFRRREEEALCSICTNGTVIATGGSAIYCSAGMEHLRSIGRVVYLKIPYEVMEKRVGDPRVRGIAIAPGATFRDLYEERVPFYERYADLTFSENDDDSFAQMAEELLKLL